MASGRLMWGKDMNCAQTPQLAMEEYALSRYFVITNFSSQRCTLKSWWTEGRRWGCNSSKNVIALPSHVSINRWDCIPAYGPNQDQRINKPAH